MEASVLFWNGRAISVDLPNAVDLRVAKTDPGVRGDTVSGALKQATRRRATRSTCRSSSTRAIS